MIYFDNAATSWPKPPEVYRELLGIVSGEYGNPGRGSHRMALAASEKIYDCRCAVAEMFGSDHPENVVFTYNDTYALNIAIKAFSRPGCGILISNIEHNSVLRPVAALSKKNIHYGIYKSGVSDEEVISDIKRLITPKTRIIVANHGSNICGLRLPIEKIGALVKEINHRRGFIGNSSVQGRNPLYFVVDSAQTAGCAEIDIQKFGIDALCSAGHKGLYGPQGSGFVIFGDKAASSADFLSTIIEGGSGVASIDLNMPSTLPERFEAGTMSTPAIGALKKGIDFVKIRGAEEIYAHECVLGKRLTEMLTSVRNTKVYMPEKIGGTVLFNYADMSSEQLAGELEKAGICVRAGLHCAPLAHKTLGTPEYGAVRVSFSIFNTKNEVDNFYRVYSNIVK